MNPKKLLEIVLKANGAVVLLATVPVFMPLSWMALAHEKLGLGALPSGAVVEYLARSASGLYAIYGGLSWLVSRDVGRYAAVIAYLAITGIVFGALILVVDVRLGMPIWWTVGEAASVMMLGIVVLLLQGRERRVRGAMPPNGMNVPAA